MSHQHQQQQHQHQHEQHHTQFQMREHAEHYFSSDDEMFDEDDDEDMFAADDVRQAGAMVHRQFLSPPVPDARSRVAPDSSISVAGTVAATPAGPVSMAPPTVPSVGPHSRLGGSADAAAAAAAATATPVAGRARSGAMSHHGSSHSNSNNSLQRSTSSGSRSDGSALSAIRRSADASPTSLSFHGSGASGAASMSTASAGSQASLSSSTSSGHSRDGIAAAWSARSARRVRSLSPYPDDDEDDDLVGRHAHVRRQLDMSDEPAAPLAATQAAASAAAAIQMQLHEPSTPPPGALSSVASLMPSFDRAATTTAPGTPPFDAASLAHLSLSAINNSSMLSAASTPLGGGGAGGGTGDSKTEQGSPVFSSPPMSAFSLRSDGRSFTADTSLTLHGTPEAAEPSHVLTPGINASSTAAAHERPLPDQDVFGADDSGMGMTPPRSAGTHYKRRTPPQRVDVPPCPPTPSRTPALTRQTSLMDTKSLDNSKEAVSFEDSFVDEGQVGSGSFSVVYKTRSKEDNKLWAVKRAKRGMRSKRDRDSTTSEFVIGQALGTHPNIVFYKHVWQQEGHVYMQLEWCSGGSIRSYLDAMPAGDAMSEDQIWLVIGDTAAGLAHLHDAGYVHLDIKPDNIFIAEDGVLKVGDLGMARRIDNTQAVDTDAGEGDNRYMAPELLNRSTRQPPGDIFSLGITAFELTWDVSLPSGGNDWHYIRTDHVPPPPAMSRSAELIAIIREMLHSDPSRRPTAAELLKHPKVAAARRGDRSCFCVSGPAPAARRVGSGSCNENELGIPDFGSSSSLLEGLQEEDGDISLADISPAGAGAGAGAAAPAGAWHRGHVHATMQHHQPRRLNMGQGPAGASQSAMDIMAAMQQEQQQQQQQQRLSISCPSPSPSFLDSIQSSTAAAPAPAPMGEAPPGSARASVARPRAYSASTSQPTQVQQRPPRPLSTTAASAASASAGRLQLLVRIPTHERLAAASRCSPLHVMSPRCGTPTDQPISWQWHK